MAYCTKKSQHLVINTITRMLTPLMIWICIFIVSLQLCFNLQSSPNYTYISLQNVSPDCSTYISFQNIPSNRSTYISFRNISSNCSKLAGLGLPGAHASAAADSHRNGRSSSFSFSSFVGIPTSIDNC